MEKFPIPTMTIFIQLIRSLMALLFLVAVLTKIFDFASFTKTVAEFGVPSFWGRKLAAAVLGAEFVVFVGLLTPSFAWQASLLSCVLIGAFESALIFNLLRGNRPQCHCFGSLGSSQISWQTVCRNAVLLLVSASLVALGRNRVNTSVIPSWSLGPEDLALIALTAFTVASSAIALWFALHLLRQHGRLLTRIETLENKLASQSNASAKPVVPHRPGLPIGTAAPSFALPNLAGELISLESVQAKGLPTLLLFADAGCGPCLSLLPQIHTWQDSLQHAVRILVITSGKESKVREKFAPLSPSLVLRQSAREVAESYLCHGTPGALIVDADGRIASGLAAGTEEIARLVEAAAQHNTVHVRRAAAGQPLDESKTIKALRRGDTAPYFSLPDLSGKQVVFTGTLPHPHLFVFWNPKCSFCMRMSGQLEAMDTGVPDTVRLAVVSMGPVSENFALGLRSPVLIDNQFSLGRAFGARGTPSAVYVEANGTLASDLAVGQDAIVRLAIDVGIMEAAGEYEVPPSGSVLPITEKPASIR